jgi:hypothetical protein
MGAPGQRKSHAGSLSATIDTKARKTGQWTGWNIKGLVGQPTWTQGTTSSLNTPTFTDVSLDEAVVTTTWGGWQAEPGENPADCLRTDSIDGVPVVSELHNVQETVSTVEGDVLPTGDITVISTTYDTPYSVGPAKVFATYVAKGDTRAIN